MAWPRWSHSNRPPNPLNSVNPVYNKKFLGYFLAAAGIISFLWCETISAADPGFIDTHMHIDGRYQASGSGSMNGPGPGPRRTPRSPQRGGPGQEKMIKDYEAAAANLISKMDKLGIEKAVIMPPPQSPNQPGGYTYEDLLGAVRKYPTRLALAAGGGELSPLITAANASNVTEETKEIFRQKVAEMIQDGAKAFGEMAALHYSFHSTHVFNQIPADHPLFLLLADLAAEYNVPIDLHMEAVLEDEPTSQALRRRSSNNPAVTKATIPGFERLLAHNRSAKIVWTHVGWDNTGHLTVELLRRLLTDHSNLYGAIKFVSQEYETFGLGNKIAKEPSLELDEGWLQLLRDFPDRFMVGADEFVGITGKTTRKGPPSLEDTWTLIAKLPEDIRAKVGRDNALRVYRL